ncbi:hypothetical protein [Devosia salina]|uniref:Tyr recombinase domain-containing protein n=1 Tax=Devosia salina TaxID=2860336 RepID=A0ABX8WIA5_9HYPH|nr:hypothetical protein [Devosia salina]QYO77749.1 hypothetical protein K1X15_04045 [Devosia salina]
MLEVLLRLDRRANAFAVLWPPLEAALDARRARIPKAARRTSALKVVDATDEEARTLFIELKRHALAHKRLFAILAALYVLVANHSGFRPIELVGARIEGSRLFLRSAKRRAGMPELRSHDLSPLHADVRVAVALLIDLTPDAMTASQFEDWHKAMAAQMRRACKRVGIRILSPYSFRHVAIATWAKAGLSPAEIAELAGHLSARTHITHYARAKVGHQRKALIRPVPGLQPRIDGQLGAPTGQVKQAAGQLLPDRGNTHAAGNSAPQDPTFDFSDMPAPIYRVDPTRPALTAEEIAAARAHIPDAGDPETIAANIRRAQARMREKERDLDAVSSLNSTLEDD